MPNIRVTLGGDTAYVTGTVNGQAAVFVPIDETVWQTAAERTENDRYAVELLAYDKLGRCTAFSWTGFYGDGSLHWHYTARDCLHAEDLIQIETACAFLRDRLNGYGYITSFTVKTDWARTDFPTPGALRRIRSNIEALQDVFMRMPDWRDLAARMMDDGRETLGPDEVNAMTWDLHILGVWLDRMAAVFRYSGELFAGEGEYL